MGGLDVIEELKLLSGQLNETWNQCKEDVSKVDWSEGDKGQVISKLDDNQMPAKFMDNIMKYKIIEVKKLLDEPDVSGNEDLKKEVLLSIIYAEIAKNTAERIEYHEDEGFE